MNNDIYNLIEYAKRVYEISPNDSRKSFYGKAKVYVTDSGDEILISYDTPVLMRTTDGKLIRLWDGWSATTGRHIKAFANLNKAEFCALSQEQKLYPLIRFQIEIKTKMKSVWNRIEIRNRKVLCVNRKK